MDVWKRPVHVGLREVIPSFSRSKEGVKSNYSSLILLRVGESKFMPQRFGSVEHNGIETLP